ncbi:hypothetical protein Vadar_024588 [Vaccinium darrowii]|uniref:Uncharacterized protein n=1 Tax=Vaccinium darrowii TaxID=229202 RepID=A0ACB7XCJ9_9ERIC|nr:hypothetical protein Vadar_024588 [Vaccinium darrowii]
MHTSRNLGYFTNGDARPGKERGPIDHQRSPPPPATTATATPSSPPPETATTTKVSLCLHSRSVPSKPPSSSLALPKTRTTWVGHVNYKDPHFNVGMPVFSIHGNHDDPAGVDNLSTIDILSACNLVNYFGKMVLEGSGVGQIALYPILIRKGSTSVALYGLGNIRDERLNRMFQTPHAVQWMQPEPQEGCQVSDWFNILVLHQNSDAANLALGNMGDAKSYANEKADRAKDMTGDAKETMESTMSQGREK